MSNYVRVVLNVPVVMPQTVASALFATQQNEGAWYFNVNLGPAAKSLSGAEYSTPELRREGSLDLALIILYLLPLFLILVGYGVWTTDRASHVERIVAMGVRSCSRVYLQRLLLASSPIVALTLLSCMAVMTISRRLVESLGGEGFR